jgi:hypothetical protein
MGMASTIPWREARALSGENSIFADPRINSARSTLLLVEQRAEAGDGFCTIARKSSATRCRLVGRVLGQVN